MHLEVVLPDQDRKYTLPQFNKIRLLIPLISPRFSIPTSISFQINKMKQQTKAKDEMFTNNSDGAVLAFLVLYYCIFALFWPTPVHFPWFLVSLHWLLFYNVYLHTHSFSIQYRSEILWYFSGSVLILQNILQIKYIVANGQFSYLFKAK